jgi:hypothetical protein
VNTHDWIRLARNQATTDAERVRDAAPILLAACKRALGGMRDHEGTEYMRAAIEAATGEPCE